MGENYVLTGIVVQGNQLGRKIGFPTANLLPGQDTATSLKKGVYAVRVMVKDNMFGGMANIGIRPTLEQHDLTVEAHLFDFSQDIYGETITIFFYDYIREERKFAGIDELKSQLEKDKSIIGRILSDRRDLNSETQ